MITLDPEFVGSITPPTKFTTDINGKTDVPFARLPRQHRLKLQGRADETEEVSEEEDREAGEEGKATRKEEEEKKRMRGRNKAIKRYLRKQRKNVIDPKAVRISLLRSFTPLSLLSLKMALRERLLKERGQRKKVRDAAKGIQEDRLPSALDRFRT
jgi:U3 small nucleolar RNA-associated protein 7